MSLHLEDKKAAFVGMIVTTALLFVMAFTIVKLTNAHFEEKPRQRRRKPSSAACWLLVAGDWSTCQSRSPGTSFDRASRGFSF